MIIPAVAYIRVSGTGQADGNGFDRQTEAIAVFASKAGYHLEATFQDVHTGTDEAINRPGFSEMAANLNGTKTVIVERLDRLARSILVQEQAITWLAAHGFHLLVADTEEDVTNAYLADPMKRALIQMQGVFAELEKSMLVKKLRIAREKKRKEIGKCEGRKAYGEIDPLERATIQAIFKLRHEGNTYDKIAEELNFAGAATRTGRKWTKNSVRGVVFGRIYKEIREREIND